jgi:hypothetical protein
MKRAGSTGEMASACAAPRLAACFPTQELLMKKVRLAMIVLVAAWLASACGSLPPAPSYVPSPFAGMHGQ